MAPSPITIGTVGPRPGGTGPGSHADLFPGVVIDDIGIDVLGMDRGVGWHLGLRGKKAVYLREVPKLAAERGWDAIAVIGAPVELMNPGLYRDLQAVVDVPVVTAMVSCAAALKAFSVGRALLMTGFFEELDHLLTGYFVHEGIELVRQESKPYATYDEGSQASADAVFDQTKRAVAADGNVDAVYFQGALPNREIIGRIESELGLPVVSSQVANYWYLLNKLDSPRPVEGAGRLLSEWPALPAG